MNTPSHTDLTVAYLRQEFAGQEVLVFCAPLEHLDAIAKELKLPPEKACDLVHADIFIYAPTSGGMIGTICNQFDEDTYGFVLAWDGSTIVSENT